MFGGGGGGGDELKEDTVVVGIRKKLCYRRFRCSENIVGYVKLVDSDPHRCVRAEPGIGSRYCATGLCFRKTSTRP